MIVLGSHSLRNPTRVAAIRDRLFALALGIGCSEINASRVASTLSDFCKRQCHARNPMEIRASLQKGTLHPELVFELCCEREPVDCAGLKTLFNEMNPILVDEKHSFAVTLVLPDSVRDLSTSQIENLSAAFTTPSNEMLMAMVQDRNDELERQSRELRQAVTTAKKADRAKSEFLANMSHEIRTPMNAVLGFTEILNDIEKEPQKQHYIKRIHTSGQSLLGIINDILDLSKIESGKLDLQYSPTQLGPLCEDIQAIFSQKVGDKGLAFKVDIDETVPSQLVLDEGRLRQVIINLVGNAYKFTHKGSILLAVECTDRGGALVDLMVRVTDTGIGIPADQHNKIFGAFDQVVGQKDAEYGGTGLGLAISLRIVELMGGSIDVESEVNEGTTFAIHIPDVEVASETDTHTNGRSECTDISFEPGTILVADDIDYNREILTAYLSQWDFTVHQAVNGREAVEKAHEYMPDMILMDMKMPEMGGLEATELIKGDEKTSHIPIFAVTASVLKEDEMKIKQVCDGFIRKPVGKMELVKKMIDFLPHGQADVSSEKDVQPQKTEEPAEYVVPPREDLDQLYHLAMRGIMNDITDFTNSLKTAEASYTAFAQEIEIMAANYEDEEIVELIEKCLKGETHDS